MSGPRASQLLKSVVIVLAIGGLLVASPAPVTATDSTAYARLLGTHVRLGTVNGIGLHLVDYAAVKADPQHEALADFSGAKLDRLDSESER